ncbi:RES domain-containing protein [Cobetia crustatorum]|uniref:RES domain-containing protein n=1 Tax=Cobetia crustatorum TaxID=553385 RepID=A0A558HNN4_9GAMM|nr:RES domain-containing protein [Cobetia crustatorum]TVU70717.1 hypothetical protein FQP86_08905 [Cobetia crustatorum]
MSTITDKYSPLELSYLVEKIKDFDAMSTENRKSFLGELIDTHPLLCYEFTEGSAFRRTRVIPEDFCPSNIDDLLWNPYTISVGRANPQGFSVLYVSDRIETSLREARVIDGTVSLSEFKIRQGKRFRFCPIGELVRVQRTGSSPFIGKHSKRIQNSLNSCESDELKSLLITDSFLLKCFLENNTSYDLSSHIAKCIFDKDVNIEGIAYASVQQDNAQNIAIKSDVFWESWSVVGVRIMSVSYLAEGFYHSFDIGHVTNIDADGSFKWVMNTYRDSGIHPLTPWFRKS